MRDSRSIWVVAAFALAAAGCKPLYGNPPEDMKRPPRTKPPKAPKGEDTAVARQLDPNCQYNFHLKSNSVKREQSAAAALLTTGDGQASQALKEEDVKVKTAKYLSSLDSYKQALVKDPYYADATLRLALTYDKFNNKGCALALLTRIGTLQTNATYAADAARVADRVHATAEWFDGYRNEALKAVNR
jgi:hypothetical protein